MTASGNARGRRADLVDVARDQLRGRAAPRAAEIAETVLRSALRAPRRTTPIQAEAGGFLQISDRVLITLLRHQVDGALTGAAVGRVGLSIDRDDRLEELTVELFAQYGRVLGEVAEQARTVVDQVLLELGIGAPATVAVVVAHVHISDITVGDPHLVDPSDGAFA